MIIVTIALWIIAVILIVTNGETKSVRWGASLAFLCGLGGFSVVLEENIAAFIGVNYKISEMTNTVLQILISVFSSLAHYLGPYCMLMFGITYAGILNLQWEMRLGVIALIPITITFLFFPTHSYYLKTTEELTSYYQILSIWSVPYMSGGNGLLLLAYLREQNSKLKKQKLLTCICVVPFITFSIVTNYILRAFGMQQSWRYNVCIIIIQFLCFMYFAYKYGILGIRLKFEKERLDSTMKAITYGTAILNHSIKNEIFKISLCMNNIRKYVHKSKVDIDDIDENIQTVLDSTNHLTAMMKRIQEQMEEIVLIESRTDLAEIIGKSLEMQKYYLDNKRITVVKNYGPGFVVNCDQIHITEVLNNVIKNAVEALSGNGRLEISVYSNRTEVVIEVKDNGTGISKDNVKYVFDPFFSTKRFSTNFGLGLSYSYNVMQYHNGQLLIQSEENIGTVVSLLFPKERVLTVMCA